MVQCATRHFEQKPAEEGAQPFAFLTQFLIDVQIGSNRWDFRTFVQIDAIQIDM
jgi:DNA-directed RNA polymerase delta subunit